AKKAKVKLTELVEAPEGGQEKALEAMLHGGKVELSATGKEKLIGIIKQAIEMTQKPENIEKAQDISLPSGEKVGTTRVDLADLPTERETMMLDAIAKADKFIYLPGFVVTRAVAAAIVARKQELEAQGKQLDVKIIADPGVYPGGDTPNSWGVKFLEDHGITARWAMLTRSGWHDRKIHAKQLITDKGEMTGSTNFSNKGMKDNWETSTFVHFNPDDPKSVADQERSVEQFMELWQNNSFELSTLDLAGCWNRYKPAEGKEYMVEDSRNGAVKKIIGWLEDYEKETAGFMGRLAKRPDIAPVVQSLVDEGYSEGDSILKGVVSVIGERSYYEGLSQLPAYKTLMEEKAKVEAWKAKEARYHKG
ncbi:MAG: hypothetical protein KC910_36345, partial [Candidatus Eremiobacteraeota bacterium]|nr:hypothetical protein [Candidatus Eremiobacteraeota bacterium]